MSKRKKGKGYDSSSGHAPKSKKYIPRGNPINEKFGTVIDSGSGKSKFVGRGRKKDRPLDSFESWEDLQLRKKLFKMWSEGKLK